MDDIKKIIKNAYDHDRNALALRHIRKLYLACEMNNNFEEAFDLRLQSIEVMLGLGKHSTAEKLIHVLETKLSLVSEPIIHARYYHTLGIINFYNNHIIEALENFETSMTKSFELNQMDLWNNTRLWREIALIHFYEPAGLNHMFEMISVLKSDKSWILSMLCAHYVIGSYRLKKTVLPSMLEQLSTYIDQSYFGPYALYKIGLILLNNDPNNDLSAQLLEISQLISKTQGIKGDFRIIHEFFNRYPEVLTLQDGLLAKWGQTYLVPLINANELDQSKLFSNVSSEPKVSVTSCLNCDNRCCYDGVYVTYAEEEKIKRHLEKYPEDFKNVPLDFLEAGEWEFLFGGKRTKRVFHEYLRSDYPSHFEKTICIFALEDGSCSLQRSAIKHHMHPWSVKPELCWEFPLIGLFNEDALNKPHYFGEKDPHYFDESQPGYLSFLPCSKVTDEGISWKLMYKNELQYYLAKKTNKNLGKKE